MDKMATSSRVYIKNVRVVNLTNRTLKNSVQWEARYYNASPLFVTWGYNVEKTLVQPVGGGQPCR